MVKSKSNQPTDTIKNVLKTKISPTEVKVGIKTLKSLKDGRVLIQVGSIDETNLLSANIKERCGDELEVNISKLWKPRVIIRNIPHDITVENIEETILFQNAELNLKPGEVAARFKFSTKRGAIRMVIEVGPEARNKLLQTKLKIGWLICSVGDYLVAKRCFRCSRYNQTSRLQGRGNVPFVRRGTYTEGLQSSLKPTQMFQLYDLQPVQQEGQNI